MFRICALNYTRNNKVQCLLDEREQLLRLELKEYEQEHRPRSRSPTANPTHPAAAETHHNVEAAAVYTSMARPIMPSSLSSSSMPSSSRRIGVSLAAVPESSSHHRAYPSASTLDPRPTPTDNESSNLDLSEIHANMAMISDGSRYNGHNRVDSNQLPPYSPGNQRTMNGHGNENNNALLSDYVKGETRAQDMKDTGNFQ